MERLIYLEDGIYKAKNAARELKTLTVGRDINENDSNRSLVYNGTSNISLNLSTTPVISSPATRWEIGTEIEIIEMSTGLISITKGANVNIIVYNNASLTLLGAGAVATLKLISQDGALDNWLFVGYV